MQLCGQLWNDIHAQCHKIMTSSIQLVYEDSYSILDDLMKTLNEEATFTDKKAEHCSFSLQYLSAHIAKKVLSGDKLSSRLDFSLNIFDSVSRILNKNLADEL